MLPQPLPYMFLETLFMSFCGSPLGMFLAPAVIFPEIVNGQLRFTANYENTGSKITSHSSRCRNKVNGQRP